ncbi:MAG: hypothetical protein PF485_14650 [Bacteroidales bacterium]|jgi:hypothetical protein|nr:hypothetical protein [Bacteroidales bacterium]
MNKKILIVIIVVSILILTLFGSWLIWFLKPEKTLGVYILDKTVPTMERNEHKSFNWILNHNRFVKANGDLYDVNNDYYGFFPLSSKSQEFDFRSIRIHEIEDIADTYDMLYYADTYGVYYNEWYQKGAKDVKYSQKFYGGLNQNDFLLLKEMKEQRKLIITEFNLYNAPTNGLIREKVEELFSLNWSGWTGKYFSSLDTVNGDNFPPWIVSLYQDQNNNQWPFKNPGIVLVHKFGTIAILEQGTHLNQELPFIIVKKEAMERFGIPEMVYYPQWFDITFTGNKNKVLANFKIHVNAKGDSLLRHYNLKPVFPAVIEHKNDYNFYYFGGDFAENSINSKTAFFEGYHNLVSLLQGSNYNSSDKFYWQFYVPMMTKIMDDYYQTLDK